MELTESKYTGITVIFPGMHQCEITSIEKIVYSWENTGEVFKLSIRYC